jgi:hypothetical protein
MFTSTCENIDLPKNDPHLTKTERGSLRRTDVVDAVGDDSLAGSQQLIRTRNWQKNATYHAARHNRDGYADNFKHGALCPLTSEYRWAFNVVLSGAGTATFMHARAPAVDAPEKGGLWQ